MENKQSYKLPISVKGIVFENSKVWLRKNERNEWELPGGKLDQGEQPPQTVIRELKEELGFNVEIINIIQTEVYSIQKFPNESEGVLVITYLCKLLDKTGDFEFDGGRVKQSFKILLLMKLKNSQCRSFIKRQSKKPKKKLIDN